MPAALSRWRILALFALVSLATRGPFAFFPFLNVDEAAHVVGSWELLRGGRLYVDYADHKPPLTSVHYALAQLLLGRGMLAVRLVTILLTVPLTALALSAFHRHTARGLAAGLLYLLFGTVYLAGDMQAVNGELLMVLPAAWALALLREPEAAARPLSCAGAGALIAMGALFKPQAAAWGLALAWAAWRGNPAARTRTACLCALAAGFAAPLLATAAVFAAAGTLPEFLYWNVTHNIHYASQAMPWAAGLGRAGRFLLPWLILTLPLWWLAWRSRALLDAHRWRVAAGALVCSVPAVCIGLRFFPHYFIQLCPPLALLGAPYAAELARPPRPRAAWALAAWTVATVAVALPANLYVLTRTRAVEETRPVFEDVARRLRADPCFPDARLFVWGFAPEFYYTTGLRPGSRFVIPASTVSGYEPGNPDPRAAAMSIRDDHWRLLISDLEQSQTTYVLDTARSGLHRWRAFPAQAFPRLWTLLRRDFVLLDDVQGVAIYRRRGCER
jgi:hypothetical protein